VLGFKAFLFQCLFDSALDCRNLPGALTTADYKVAGEAANTINIKQNDVRSLLITGSFDYLSCCFYSFQNLTPDSNLCN